MAWPDRSALMDFVAQLFSMLTNSSCFVWNVRGLNERARRNVVKEFVLLLKPTIVCIQETKLSSICNNVAVEIVGASFDYDFVPADGAAGGIMLAWARDCWSVDSLHRGRFSLTARFSSRAPLGQPWWISVVYGPQLDSDKIEFLDELRQFRAASLGPWFLCGDFNMIYRAQDKNNDRLDRRSMRRFRAFLDQLQLEEINMVGRLYTWSSRREQPTLELLDRMFATADWLSAFPNHVLKPLSSDCSDHCPLLLHHHVYNGAKRRFKFEPYWIKLPGYMEVVAAAWAFGADPFRILDHKLRNVAKALRSWSNSKLSNIRMQLAMAREVILCLDGEQERRPLDSWEFNLHCALKRQVLGLASLSRTIARQRSRILFLAEGDANTKFYHLQACHRNRHNHIDSIISDGSQLINDREMEDALYNHYNTILGVNFERTRRIAFEAIGLPSVDLDALEVLFTEDEV